MYGYFVGIIICEPFEMIVRKKAKMMTKILWDDGSITENPVGQQLVKIIEAAHTRRKASL